MILEEITLNTLHSDQGPYTDAASADSWLRDLEKIVKNTKENWKIQKVC